jgi:hypothetical protein
MLISPRGIQEEMVFSKYLPSHLPMDLSVILPPTALDGAPRLGRAPQHTRLGCFGRVRRLAKTVLEFRRKYGFYVLCLNHCDLS